MGRNLTFALSFVAILILAAPSNCLAQCSWCVTVTDDCCDGDFASVDYTTTCDAASVWVYYDINAQDKVEILMYEVSGGIETLLAHVDASGQHCGCAKYQIYANVNAGHSLRFKVNCEACTNHCVNQNAQVWFFTPSANTCAGNCPGN